MNRIKSSFAAGFLLATAAFTGAALAHDDQDRPPMGPDHGQMGYGHPPGPYGGPYGHHGMRGGLSYLADELDLSDEQRKKVRDILGKTRSQARDLGEEMSDIRDQMEDVLDGKGYGPDFDKLARRKGELIGQMIILKAKTRAQIAEVLTPEQKEEFEDIAGDMDDYGPGRGGWRGYGW